MQHYGISAKVAVGEKCLIRNRYGLPRLAEVSVVKDRFYIVKYEVNGATFTEKFARSTHAKWGTSHNIWSAYCSFPQFYGDEKSPEDVLVEEIEAKRIGEERDVNLRTISSFTGRGRMNSNEDIAAVASLVRQLTEKQER